MKRLLLLSLLAISMPSFASVTLTVSVANISGTPYNGSYIRADLQNCPNPTILNSSASVTTPQKFYLPNNSNQITFTIADNITQIACNGNQLSYWTFTYVQGVTQTQLKSVELPPGTFNLANLANVVAPPWNPGVIQGPTGAQGPQGSGPPYYGLWTSAQTYSQGDTVSYNNATYISLVSNNLANTPSTSLAYWSVYVNPSGVSINPSLSQTIMQPSSTYFNVNNLMAYGTPAFIAFGTTAGSPDAWLSRSAAGVFSLDGGSQGSGSGILNLSALRSGGTAPSGHTFIGNGNSYVDAALNYQTVKIADAALAAKPALNFTSNFTSTTTTPENTIDLSSLGTAGTYTFPSSITTDANGRVSAVVSGTTASITATAKSQGVIYQNTGTTNRIVAFSLNASGGCTANFYYGTSSPPTNVYAKSSVSGGGSADSMISAVIPPNYYYEITSDHCNTDAWNEVQ